jgi:hypothetical protein
MCARLCAQRITGTDIAGLDRPSTPVLGGETMRRTTVAIVLAALGTGTAWAQEDADANRTAVSVVGGLSVGSSSSPFGRGFEFHGSDSGAAFAVGGSVAHDLTSRFTLEATGLYLDRGSSAWSADAGFRLNLVPSSRTLVPYFAVSGGLYGESFDAGGDRGEVRLETRDPRAIFVSGGRAGEPFRGGFGAGAPGREDDFRDDVSTHRTDGMVTLGGGVRFASGAHVFVRPDVRAQFVFGSDTRVLGLFTLNFGYRF